MKVQLLIVHIFVPSYKPQQKLDGRVILKIRPIETHIDKVVWSNLLQYIERSKYEIYSITNMHTAVLVYI